MRNIERRRESSIHTYIPRGANPRKTAVGRGMKGGDSVTAYGFRGKYTAGPAESTAARHRSTKTNFKLSKPRFEKRRRWRRKGEEGHATGGAASASIPPLRQRPAIEVGLWFFAVLLRPLHPCSFNLSLSRGLKNRIEYRDRLGSERWYAICPNAKYVSFGARVLFQSSIPHKNVVDLSNYNRRKAKGSFERKNFRRANKSTVIYIFFRYINWNSFDNSCRVINSGAILQNHVQASVNIYDA